jgi:enoyl-CoA hydratase/carnithine racemase
MILDMPIRDSQLDVELRGTLGVLTLNRPAALNALTLTMVRQLHKELDRLRKDDSIGAVLLRGAGDKAFCAGGDVRAIYDSFKAGTAEYMTFFEEEYLLDHAIHRYSKPTFALMDGYVMGGGMGLSQGCRTRIVTERTRMAMPEVGIGYFPDVGGSYFLSRLPGALGLYLGLTGVQLHAADALYCGLADAYLPSHRIGEFVDAVAECDWRGDASAQWSELAGVVEAIPSDAPLKRAREAVDLHFSAPSVPEILDSLRSEVRPEFSLWAAATLATMRVRSPLAMSVTLEQLRRAAGMTLEQCLQMELTMGQEWVPRGDMIEGVRALIVDKDKNPHWNPPTLDQVDQTLVESFFTGRPGGRELRL